MAMAPVLHQAVPMFNRFTVVFVSVLVSASALAISWRAKKAQHENCE
jgi:hypothetical protein